MMRINNLFLNCCFLINLLTYNRLTFDFSLDNYNCYFKIYNYNFNKIILKINNEEIDYKLNDKVYFFNKDNLLYNHKIEIYLDNKFYSNIYYKNINYNVDLNKENNIYLDYFFYSVDDLIVLNNKNNNFIIDKEIDYEVNNKIKIKELFNYQLDNKHLIKDIYLLIEIEKGFYKSYYNEFYKGYIFKLDNELNSYNNEIKEYIYLPKNYNKNKLVIKMFFCLKKYYLYVIRNVYFSSKNILSIDIVDEDNNYDIERKVI